MITRRVLLRGAGAVALAFPHPARAEGQGAGMPLVGTLTGGGPRTSDEAFLGGLRRLGYTEGPTVRIEARHYEGKPERCPALAPSSCLFHPWCWVERTGPSSEVRVSERRDPPRPRAAFRSPRFGQPATFMLLPLGIEDATKRVQRAASVARA